MDNANAHNFRVLFLCDILSGSNPTGWALHPQILVKEKSNKSVGTNFEINTEDPILRGALWRDR